MTKEKILHNILDLCLEINNTSKYSAFIRFSGHVNLFEVEITDKRKSRNAKKYLYRDVYIDKENIKEELKELEKKIKSFL